MIIQLQAIRVKNRATVRFNAEVMQTHPDPAILADRHHPLRYDHDRIVRAQWRQGVAGAPQRMHPSASMLAGVGVPAAVHGSSTAVCAGARTWPLPSRRNTREPGYAPAVADWEFMELDLDADLARQHGRIDACITCHERSRHGALFRTYLERWSGTAVPRLDGQRRVIE